MAWIEVHQELIQHPKLKRLARMLNVSKFEAAGRLFAFWCWALDYADNGNLSRFDASDIADAMEWDGDPQCLIDAMIECGPGDSSGFIERRDGALFVHDWNDYMGRLLSMREKNRERQKRFQHKKAAVAGAAVMSPLSNDNITVMSPLDNRNITGLPNQTVPNQTKQGQKNKNTDSAPVSPKPAEPILDLEGAQALTTLTQMYELCPDYVPDPPKEIRLVQELQQEHPGVPIVAEFRKARDWLEGKPVKERKKNLRAFLRNWVSNAVNRYGAGRKFAVYQEVATFVPDTGGGAGNA
ncbi:MAG: hypothetical protein K6E38_00210 [Fretibacterium sp.]|nr:hypothetical protein [Fretibacterium sp.]